MARTYTTVGWEDGTVLQPAKVTVQGTEYNVENEVVTGRTPINAQNLRKMDNEIKRIVEEDIPSVYDEKLLTISDTAPSECIEGDKYYNTTDNKIYTAVATDTWSQDGDTPIEGKLYIVFNEQSTYAYNGTTLVSVGGGSGSSDIIIIGDESEATEDTKLIIEEEDMNLDMQGTDFLNEYSESINKGYSCDYLNNNMLKVKTVTYTPTYSASATSQGGYFITTQSVKNIAGLSNDTTILSAYATPVGAQADYNFFIQEFTTDFSQFGIYCSAQAQVILTVFYI